MTNDKLEEFYRHYIRLANTRNFDAIADLVNADVTINGAPYRRRDVVDSLRAIVDVVPDFTWQIEDLFADDNRIFARLRDTGTPKLDWLGLSPTGANLTFTEFASYRLRDGRFADMWFLMDYKTIVQQLGSQL